MPEIFRTASLRLASLYVVFLAVSAVVLGGAVFLAARSALEQQAAARIDVEIAVLQGEFRTVGLHRLTAAVASRGRGASALDYLLQRDGTEHLAGEIPLLPALRPG